MTKKIAVVIITSTLALGIFLGVFFGRNSKTEELRNRIILDVFELQKLQSVGVEDFKRDYIQKCLLARQVYQFSWYKSEDTKIGSLQLKKYYAMDLQAYNRVVELSWDLNRQLSIPMDSWENYIMLSKWIVESGLCPWIEHKTGEVVRFTGYTEEGLKYAMFVYLHESGISRGHPLYIPELFREGLTEQQIYDAFKNIENVVKFDYAYIRYLLSRYDYKWDWVLTAFHFGLDKTDYWNSIGMKDIPNFRLDGIWYTIYLRKYYQWNFEIAQGISIGKMSRISAWELIEGSSKQLSKFNSKYISTLKLKVKSQQKIEELQEKYESLKKEFDEYKKLNDEILKSMAELNDMDVNDRKTYKEKVRELEKKIRVQYKKIQTKK